MVIADWQTAILQSGKQRFYLLIVFFTIALCLAVTSVTQQAIQIKPIIPSVSVLDLFLFSWISASAIFTVLVKTYLRGLIFLGMFGLGIALLFLVNAAPDVAMTQVLVETLIVIIVVLNLYRQPNLPKIVAEKRKWQMVNMIIAVTIGIIITLLLLTVTHQPFNSEIGNYFIENSIPLAYGRNVVNVILVDFRALDTLGETIVIAVAAIGIYGMLKIHKESKK